MLVTTPWRPAFRALVGKKRARAFGGRSSSTVQSPLVAQHLDMRLSLISVGLLLLSIVILSSVEASSTRQTSKLAFRSGDRLQHSTLPRSEKCVFSTLLPPPFYTHDDSNAVFVALNAVRVTYSP